MIVVLGGSGYDESEFVRVLVKRGLPFKSVSRCEVKLYALPI